MTLEARKLWKQAKMKLQLQSHEQQVNLYEIWMTWRHEQKTYVKYMKMMQITPKYAKYYDSILKDMKSTETKQVLKANVK